MFRPHWVCPPSWLCAFPVYTAQAPGCSIWALSCLWFQFSGTPQKHGLAWACVLCLPHPSSSGRQELDGRTLPGRCALSPLWFRPQFLCVPGGCPSLVSFQVASSLDSPSGCRPSRISGSLWLETAGLFAVWQGVPSLGPSLPLSPPPCLLPPVGDGPVHSQLALLWNCSVPLFCE